MRHLLTTTAGLCALVIAQAAHAEDPEAPTPPNELELSDDPGEDESPTEEELDRASEALDVEEEAPLAAEAAPEQEQQELLSAPSITVVDLPQAAPRETRVRPFAAVMLGLAVPTATYRPAPIGQIAGGVVLPWAGQRFRPFVSLALTRPGTSGTVEDDRLSAPFLYDTHQWAFSTTFGAGARLLPASDAVSPELELGLSINALSAQVQGSVGDEAVTPASESKTRVGLHAALLLDIAAGPGHVIFGGQLAVFGQDGVLYKDGPLVLLSPMVGYRIVP